MITRGIAAALVLALGLGAGCTNDDKGDKRAADNTGINDRDRKDTAVTAGSADVDKSDVDIMASIRKRVMDDGDLSFNAHNVKIVAQDGVVTLKGPVASATEKARIEQIAVDVVGKKNVVNQLDIAP